MSQPPLLTPLNFYFQGQCIPQPVTTLLYVQLGPHRTRWPFFLVLLGRATRFRSLETSGVVPWSRPYGMCSKAIMAVDRSGNGPVARHRYTSTVCYMFLSTTSCKATQKKKENQLERYMHQIRIMNHYRWRDAALVNQVANFSTSGNECGLESPPSKRSNT
jgi:hypothetical protein